jgi:hypothetical protein
VPQPPDRVEKANRGLTRLGYEFSTPCRQHMPSWLNADHVPSSRSLFWTSCEASSPADKFLFCSLSKWQSIQSQLTNSVPHRLTLYISHNSRSKYHNSKANQPAELLTGYNQPSHRAGAAHCDFVTSPPFHSSQCKPEGK